MLTKARDEQRTATETGCASDGGAKERRGLTIR
jgi:hypothetical protein